MTTQQNISTFQTINPMAVVLCAVVTVITIIAIATTTTTIISTIITG